MTDLRQAAQQALEALEERYVGALRDRAIEALEAALAEPEQEPDGINWLKRDSGYFTAPTPRKPLTEGEMPTLFVGGLALNSEATTEIVRAVEKAHGIGGQHGS